jgi:hypothetical protein
MALVLGPGGVAGAPSDTVALDEAQNNGPVIAIGTGEGRHDGLCNNIYLLQGISEDGVTWTFTLEYIVRSHVSPNVITVPCPWAPTAIYHGAWNPSQGGTIPGVGDLSDSSLGLTGPSPNADGTVSYTPRVCGLLTCSQRDGTVDLLFLSG